nr:MAG TPA: hypothetical protein [Bacteriophage sp.]
MRYLQESHPRFYNSTIYHYELYFHYHHHYINYQLIHNNHYQI